MYIYLETKTNESGLEKHNLQQGYKYLGSTRCVLANKAILEKRNLVRQQQYN